MARDHRKHIPTIGLLVLVLTCGLLAGWWLVPGFGWASEPPDDPNVPTSVGPGATVPAAETRDATPEGEEAAPPASGLVPAPWQDVPPPGSPEAPSAILLDVLTGEVLYELEPDEPLAPASITKTMTLLVAYEAVEAGLVGWDDQVVISESAQRMGGAQAFLSAGQTFSFADLVKAVAVASANDASVAVAEHVAGSEAAFVEMMNERAAALGMESTHFANPHGLDDPDHYMSARDVGLVSRALLYHFPEVVELTSIWTYTFEVADDCCLLTNTNKMVRHYPGVDGLKTGWTRMAGYGVAATSEHENTRLLAVIMGHEHPQHRFQEAAELLNWGFRNFEAIGIVTGGEVLRQEPVYEGEAQTLALVAEEDFGVVVRRGEAETLMRQVEVRDPLVAPIEGGEHLGWLSVAKEDRELGRVALVAERRVARLSWPGMWWRFWRQLQPWPE